jgi:hypothetical protein
MTQQWLTVFGLVLDFAGFMMLLREWWLAFFNEGRQMLLAEQIDRMRALRARPTMPAERNPFESLDRFEDENAIRRARAEHKATLAARRGVFVFATALIVLGFLLQLVGAWPGCCPPWRLRQADASRDALSGMFFDPEAGVVRPTRSLRGCEIAEARAGS